MDDEQFQFLSGIMIHPLAGKVKELPYTPMSATSDRLQMDEDSAIVESKISQIKDIFPDHGKGFLTACLEIYNQNPEEVIQRILEGTLHEDLQTLDTSLEKIPPPKTASSLSRYDKGKGKLMEPTTVPSTIMVPLAGEEQAEGPSFSSSSSAGRYVRKASTDMPDSETLDCRDEKNLAKTAFLISQLEYEDEYDDSFDDLGLSVGDSGLEETESLGEKLNLNRERSRETYTGSPAPNASNSKWNSRKTPQFYVKDGKNYSYKVEGSVAVANYNEASLVNEAQKELIHGLGRGGNLPLGAIKRLTETNEEQDEEADVNEMGGRGNPGATRGRGRRGGASNHHRKDRALRKQISGFSGR
ncbi:unnamed protein product [Ilex paraguariensis]|uniref:CUE domain-containing protein n=1 Tax=Ilex paraguariensis TaxID=185542 RepID=A0ABC8SE03_9AQUA